MSREIPLAVALTAACLLGSSNAWCQACCAGGAAVTPARLGLHEDVLVGVQARVAAVPGLFDDASGRYVPEGPGSSELDLEQDLVAAVRLFRRGQLALDVPIVETRRMVPGDTEFGGGIGDINLGARYDFTLAGGSLVVPGVAVLLGVTVPTGRAADASHSPLATDATGIGAYQGVIGLALEQTFGPFYVGLSGLLSARSPHSATAVSSDGTSTTTTETLAPQGSIIVAGAYVFRSEAALGVSVACNADGNAVIDGSVAPNSGHRLTTLSLLGAVPLTDAWRTQGTLFVTPPWTGLSFDQTASVGFSLMLIRSWS
jgi:hypothetical protein